ncbi:MAG: hypothetical protein FVQ81_03935 [Candidatus Glassbacteria bacterium]|nr:hypothetical protein [Candidatus Glassbacteria bacterium]
MEILLGVGLIAVLVYIILYVIGMLQTLFRSRKMVLGYEPSVVPRAESVVSAPDSVASETVEQNLDSITERMLNQKLAEVDADVAARKEEAKVEVSAWIEHEKERLQKQLEDEYGEKTEQLRNKLTKEAENIRTRMESDISGPKAREDELRGVIADLEEEILKLRNTRLAELDSETSEKRLAATAEIESWSADEKERLRTLFTKEYEGEVAKLRQELDARMNTELDKIRKLFAEVSAEEKELAKEDIKRFITKKLSPSDKE